MPAATVTLPLATLQDYVTRIFEAAVPRLLTLFAAQEVVISLVEDGRPMVALSEPNRYVHVGDELPALSPGGRALASSRPLIGNRYLRPRSPGRHPAVQQRAQPA